MKVRLSPCFRSVFRRVCVCLLALSLVSIAPAPVAALPAPLAGPARLAQAPAADSPAVGSGVVLGVVQDAERDAPLANVQVVMTGKAEELPRGRLYLPLIVKNSRMSAQGAGAATAALPAAAPQGDTLTFTTTTGSDGAFTLTAPAGSYVINFTVDNYTLDKRALQVKANQVQRVETVLLHKLDPVVKPIGSAGGEVTNSLGNTSLAFPPGALPATEQTRVTYLSNDSLPGTFADGSLPMGFASLEPEGLTFPPGKEVLWTIKYDGPLPVGTDTLCYWWDGKEGRWKDPVPGKVVATASGKALQAKVSHFSNYGHAAPAAAGQQPGGGEYVSAPVNNGQGSCQTRCTGSETNAGTGAVSESYTFHSVASAVFPILLTARYSTDNDTPAVMARVPFTITQQVPARAEWRIDFQGKTYTGTGYEAAVQWDTRNGLGYRTAPGLYEFDAQETFVYDSGQRPSLKVKGAVDVRRGDIWPFGFNWISTYDTLLVNHSATVTIIQADGQYLTYARQTSGSYKSSPGDTSVLVRTPSGEWLRTSLDSATETFDAQGRLIRLEDRNGNAQVLGYEPTGVTLPEGKWGLPTRLVSITDSSGNFTRLAYGGDGYIASVTNSAGRAYTLAHDAGGNLTRITDALGRAVAYEYDGSHRLTAFTTPEGAKTRLEYDAQGRAVRHVDALGGARTTAYGPTSNTITDELGNESTYAFNGYGAITSVKTPLGTTNYTFDEQRRVVSVDRPYTKYQYDSVGNVTRVSSATSTAMTYVPGTNRLASITNAAGHTALYGYDNRGNLTTATDALGNVIRFEYNGAGQVTRMTDALGNSLKLEYDAKGQLVRGTDALGATVSLEYDAAGNLARQTDVDGHTTTYTRDAADRTTALTDAAGGVTAYAYDRDSRITGVTDARGNATAFAYDALGRVTWITDALGRALNLTYDANGRVVSVVDAVGNTQQFAYDAGGRPVSSQYPGGGTTFTYAETGDLGGYSDATAAVTYSYPTRLPGMPDTVETTLKGTGIASTVAYDYVTSSDAVGGAASTSGDAAEAVGPDSASPAAKTGEDAPRARAPAAPRIEDLPPFPVKPAGGTNGCGVISADTTWTVADSPYVFDGCSATVVKGATLTIQPGVILKFGWKWDMLRIYGQLLAQGTASQPILFTSLDDDTGGDTNGNGSASAPVPGDWNGIRLDEGSAGNVLDHIVIRYGGADGMSTALGGYLATFTMSNSIIDKTKGHGMYFETMAPSSLTNNRFTDNTLTAGTIILNYTAPSMSLSGNVATGNGLNGLRMVGQLKGAATWTGDPNFPFVVREYNLQVMADSTLTLAPGTVVKFGDSVWDSLDVWGTFLAQGTPEQPIYFTSTRDDAVGNDTNGDGGAQPPVPGQWNGIIFKDTSTGSILDHVVVRYGGSYVDTAGVQANTKNFTVRNSTITANRGHGVYMDGGTPPLFENNIITNNKFAAVRANFHHTIGTTIELRGNTVTGNGWNGFQVDGVLTLDSVFAGQPDFPFIIPSGNLGVGAGAKLTIKAGTVVKVADAFTGLPVWGALDAQGTAGRPIYFTSIKDDTVGGDTNNDGKASQPAPDDWMYIHLQDPSGPSRLSHVVVRYAGGTGWNAAVVATHAVLGIDDSTIAYTGGRALPIVGGTVSVNNTTFLQNEAGIHVHEGAQPTLRGNRFIGNTEYAVRNESPAVVVDATSNWWGGSRGPLDASDDRPNGGWYNPDGDGDKVTDGVKYEPWNVVSGLVYGLKVATGANAVQTVRYTYDALNRVTGLAASGASSLNYGFAYDAGSRLTSMGAAPGGKGVASVLGYDAGSRVTRLTNRSPDGSTTFNDFSYVYDRTGNLTAATDAAGTTSYTYDALSRLLSASGPGFSETYTYDAVGNRTSKGGVTYAYNAADQLLSSSDGTAYTYDANGNLRTKTAGGQATAYSWDGLGQLARIDYADGTYSAYTYDSQGHRRSKRDRAGATTYYIYSGDDLVQEVDAAGKVTANYVYGGLDHPLSMTRGGATYYYLYDQLGSVVGLTDGAGGLVAGYRYDPWGNILATSGSNQSLPNPFRYTGREWDGESGLYYYRARYYDPQTGRFISRDPLALAILGHSLYAYANNNPVVLSDPSGRLTPEQEASINKRRWWQTGMGLVTGVLVGAGTLAYAVGTGGLGLIPAAFLATGVGAASGGGVAAVHELVRAPADERCLMGAFLAGYKGGLVGGAVGAVLGPIIGQSIVSAVTSLQATAANALGLTSSAGGMSIAGSGVSGAMTAKALLLATGEAMNSGALVALNAASWLGYATLWGLAAAWAGIGLSWLFNLGPK